MKDMWNTKYAEQEFVYGKAPNKFFERNINIFNTGSKLFFAAEGEGRNAVYALKNGFQAVAVDFSEEAKNKALSLAKEYLVELEYHIGDLLEIDFPAESFDGLVLIYAHMPPPIRKDIHRKIQALLKSGGKLILEGFGKNHLEVSKNNSRSSGPQNIEMLFSLEILKEDFNEIDFSMEVEEIDELDESKYHEGRSSLIRMIGTKK